MLTTAEEIDLYVAAATALLAVGTFWMAWKTGALAKLGQRQHDEATTPILRLSRTSPPGSVALNDTESESFIAVIENVGPVPADLESCHLTELDEAKLMNEGVKSPTIEAGAALQLVFSIGPAARDRLTSGDDKVLTIAYRATKSGRRFQVTERIRFEADNDLWELVDAGRAGAGLSPFLFGHLPLRASEPTIGTLASCASC